ncbi:MAG: alpha/beta hydrolase [Rhodoglobus sp.]|nr:alpha/beta hydrolase [Rhodoglobus sp.]
MSIPSPYAELLARIPVESRSIEVLGSTTKYWVYGPVDAAVTIVIAHGYRGEHHGLEPVIAQLPNVRWIGPDMPGFGESTPMTEAPHSIPGYARWLTEFIEGVGATGSAVLLGHSFGSIISSQAIASGLRPRGLVLVNPIAISGLDGPNRVATAVTVGFYRLAGRLPRRIGDYLLRHWLVTQFVSVSLAKTKDKDLRRWIHSEHHTYFSGFSNRDVVVEAFEASISAHVGEFAAQIPVPTLLVAAELDDITPIQAVRDLKDAFPDARLTELAGVGHLIHYEVPVLAAEAIGEFVGALPRDGNASA